MNYKKTLNIPKTDFPMKAGLTENTKKFKYFWQKNEIYVNLKGRISDKKYTLHDGPPYANGQIHVGHALNKILKDFVLRYKSLTGYQINYIPGWDTHGLPIENKLEKEGKYEGQSTIEKRRKCREYALSQITVQKEQFEKLHLLCDFNEIYKTLDSNFIKKELEIFHGFVEKKLLYWGLKPVAWSWSSKTALAESEIIYKEVECTSIEFWFPSVNRFKEIPENSRFLIWTTTPYTLEANLALCVNPEHTYELVEHEGDYWIAIEGKIPGKQIKTFKGEYLEGIKYFNPITKETNEVILGDHVTKDTGTGIVHTAPGFGLEDFQVCQRYSIPTYSSIDDTGKFIKSTKFSPINGLFYSDASEIVINWLKKEGYLFKTKNIKHNVGHDWRTEKPLIYKASTQWFVNIEPLKPKIGELLKTIKSNPPWMKKKLESLILSRNEWCLSRQRAWGTPIPIIFDGENPILDPKQIQHTINLLNEHGVDSWYEKDPSFFILPGLKTYGELKASRDILDVWFDSGCSWNILENQPIDLYLEGFDQLRGWFNSSSIISVAKRNSLPFKELVAHGFVLDGNGNKMSKSKGNVIDPIEIVNKYGADILRLWLGSNNYLEDIRLSDISLENTITLYRKIRNTLFRYSLSILREDFKLDESILENLEHPENIYIHSLFQNTYKKMMNHLENHKFSCIALKKLWFSKWFIIFLYVFWNREWMYIFSGCSRFSRIDSSNLKLYRRIYCS